METPDAPNSSPQSAIVRHLIPVAQQSGLLATPIAGGLGRAFVLFLFTLGDRDLNFHAALMVEIHHQRHKGHTLARYRIPHPYKFTFGHQ